MTPPMPGSVRTARGLFIAHAVIVGFGLAMLCGMFLIVGSDMDAVLAEADTSAGFLVFGLVVGAVFLVLYLVAAGKLRAGGLQARTFARVVAVLDLGGMGINLMQGLSLGTVAGIIMDIAILVALSKDDAADWFSRTETVGHA